MLVAVGRPVACRNSAMISRPENPLLRAAWIFGVRQHILLSLAQLNRFFQRPRPVGIERDARRGKSRRKRLHSLHLFCARKHAAFQFKIAESILRLCRLRQPHNCFRRQRLFIAQSEPSAGALTRPPVIQSRLPAIAHKKQIAQHRHAASLLAFAKQRRNRNSPKLPEQIEQRRLDRSQCVNRHALIERLLPAPCCILIPKPLAHRIKNRVICRDLAPHHQRRRFFQNFANLFAAGNLAHSSLTRLVGQQNKIAREIRPMRAAQIEQHAVLPGHRHNPHRRHARRFAGARRSIVVHLPLTTPLYRGAPRRIQG